MQFSCLLTSTAFRVKVRVVDVVKPGLGLSPERCSLDESIIQAY